MQCVGIWCDRTVTRLICQHSPREKRNFGWIRIIPLYLEGGFKSHHRIFNSTIFFLRSCKQRFNFNSQSSVFSFCVPAVHICMRKPGLINDSRDCEISIRINSNLWEAWAWRKIVSDCLEFMELSSQLNCYESYVKAFEIRAYGVCTFVRLCIFDFQFQITCVIQRFYCFLGMGVFWVRFAESLATREHIKEDFDIFSRIFLNFAYFFTVSS